MKFAVIHQYRKQYSIQIMCRFFGISRSGYYRYVKNLDRPRKNAGIADMIRQCHQTCHRTYGYRRVRIWLEQERGIRLNEKTVLRIMRDYDLLSQIRRRRPYNKAVECLRRYPNLLNREFRAERPNQKWVTDISYIQTGEGVLYLSIIRDLYDNSIVAHKTSVRQTAKLVTDTLRLAKRKETVTAELQLHSDRAFHHQGSGWGPDVLPYRQDGQSRHFQGFHTLPGLSVFWLPYNSVYHIFFNVLDLYSFCWYGVLPGRRQRHDAPEEIRQYSKRLFPLMRKWPLLHPLR